MQACIFGLRRDFVRLSLLNTGSTLNSAQIAQGFTQLDLRNLQGWRLHSLSGQPVPLLDCVLSDFFVPFTHQNPYTFLNTYFILMDFSVSMAAEYSTGYLKHSTCFSVAAYSRVYLISIKLNISALVECCVIWCAGFFFMVLLLLVRWFG